MQTEEIRRVGRERWSGRKEAPVVPEEQRVRAQEGASPSGSNVGKALGGPESAEREGALLRVLSDLVFYVRKDGVVLQCRAGRGKQPSLDPERVVGRRVMELLPSQMGRQAMYYMEKALRTGGVEVLQVQHALPGGVHDFEVRVASVNRQEVVALVHDVSDRRLLQKEILEVSQRERTRIGQDLHDGLGQHLTGITFLTRALQHKLEARGLPEAQEAGEIGRLVVQALSQTRNLARGLFPVEVGGDGLVPALKELAGTAEKLFHISCRVECEGDWQIANGTVATHAFRLAQEAISNSVKHGKAKAVVIALRRFEDRLELSITDNGGGMPKEGQTGKGLGLRIMNYRAQKIGGVLEIGSGPSGGTVVRCLFPEPPAEAA